MAPPRPCGRGPRPTSEESWAPARWQPCVGLIAVLVLVSAVGCAERGWLAPPVLEPLALHVEGPWLRDERGRVALLRGIDLPVVPGEPVVDNETSRAAFRRLERAGVNLVRIRIPWRAVEPQRDRFAADIVSGSVDPLIRLARAHGMTVVLALDVSPSSSAGAGAGAAPKWACSQGPGELERESAGACGFWSDVAGDRLRDHLSAIWGHLAARYGQDTRVTGFEPLVEPTLPPAVDGETFRRVILPPTREEIGRVIAASDARQIILGGPPAATTSIIMFMAAEGALGEAFARPAAQRVAGLPDDARWRQRQRRFELTFHDDPTHPAHDPTVIHVPDGLYPEGFNVEVSPSGRWRFDPATRSVLVYRSRWPEHRVVLTPSTNAGPALPLGPNDASAAP